MSRFTIRPPGPLPVTDRRSTPASAAIRAASGETIKRSGDAAAGVGAEPLPSAPAVFAGLAPGFGGALGSAAGTGAGGCSGLDSDSEANTFGRAPLPLF